MAALGVVIKLAAPGVVEGLGWAPLLVTLAGVPGALAALFLQSVLLGEGRMVAYNAVEVAQAAADPGRAPGRLRLLRPASSPARSRSSALGRYGAAFAYVVLLARRSHDRGLARTRGLARSMLAYGFRVYVAILVSFLVIRVDLLLVNAYLGRTEAGLYSIAATLADGMFVLPTVVAPQPLPASGARRSNEASAEIFRSVAVLYGLVCLATVPIAGVAIRAFFGSEFEGATSLYYWLLPGIYSLGLLTILSHHFAGRGFPRRAMAFWIVGLGINLALNFAFLPGRGAWVAALASSITYAVLLALFMWLFAREAGGFGAMRPRARRGRPLRPGRGLPQLMDVTPRENVYGHQQRLHWLRDHLQPRETVWSSSGAARAG